MMPFDARRHKSDSGAGSFPILSVIIGAEAHVVAARQRARQIAGLLGFDVQQQTRLATAVSEVTRNAYSYAGGGRVEYLLEGHARPQFLVIRVSDTGPGIANLEDVLEGRYRSDSGVGLGLIGARRLMDEFDVVSAPGKGTLVTLKKLLPRHVPAVSPRMLINLVDEIGRQEPESPLHELERQNRELMATLAELGARQEELVHLNRELEDTNRGVVALYAELDDKADHLRRADEMKSRFLSNMSHEFRTPLNSILALSRLLLDRADGQLTPDQEKQVYFIRKAAESLFELVNDLLDLAKVEAGKITVHAAEFDVHNLFGALRGMLRPLLVNPGLNLVFEEAEDIPPMITDEAKVSQILRNFISNAIKFTEHGEVRVSARREGENVVFAVTDTGIGIAPEDIERIFHEFAQIENAIQRRVKGTGLGLPLSKKLAELLGGNVEVRSELGLGSMFTASIPIFYAPEPTAKGSPAPAVDNARCSVLIISSLSDGRLAYDQYLRGTEFQAFIASSIAEARSVMRSLRPAAILLDLSAHREDSLVFLAELKSSRNSSEIPVITIGSEQDVGRVQCAGADECAMRPVSREWLIEALTRLTSRGKTHRILVIDDDEVFSYLVRQLFAGLPHQFIETRDGTEGLEVARTMRPDLIFLDLVMPGLSGFDVLRELHHDPALRDIPVIVATSKTLTAEEREKLNHAHAPVISKDLFSSGEAKAETARILSRMELSSLLAASTEQS